MLRRSRSGWVGVAHRDDELRARARNRDDAVLLTNLASDELDDLAVDLVLVEVDRGQPVLRGEEVRDTPRGHVAELRERVAEVCPDRSLLILELFGAAEGLSSFSRTRSF